MAVDSPVTAFALLMYKMLEVKASSAATTRSRRSAGTPQRFQAMTKDKTYARRY